MSDYQREKGVFRKVELSEEKAKAICADKGFEKEEWHDSFLECLIGQDQIGAGGYLKIGEDIYELLEYKRADPLDHKELLKINDSDFRFDVVYYNGGTYLEEVLERLL